MNVAHLSNRRRSQTAALARYALWLATSLSRPLLCVSLMLVSLCAAPAALGQAASFAGSPTTVATGFQNIGLVSTDPFGNAYVTDFNQGTITEIYANGAPPKVVASGLTNPIGVSADGSGNIYVGEYFAENEIKIAPGGAQSVLAYLPTSPTGSVVDATGNVFVTANNAAVVKISPSGQTSTVTSGSGYYASALDGAGNLYTSDQATRSVQFLSADGTMTNSYFSGLDIPEGVAVDKAGDLFVADKASGVFERVAATGTIQTVGSFFEPAGVATDPAGNLYVSDPNAESVTKLQLHSVNFGSANVCPAGQTTPAPCTQTETLIYDITASGSFGTPVALTQGAPGLDFRVTGSTCPGQQTAGTQCTVTVVFTPRYPGARNGAVELVDSFGNVVASTYVYGTGVGPQLAFSSGQQSIVASGIDFPGGVALDGAGDFFIVAGASGELVKQTPGGTQTTLVSGLKDPHGVAVDGAGNVFVVDSFNNRVLELPAGGGGPVSVGSGLSLPLGVAVDGSGNIFVADSRNQRVIEILAATGAQTDVGSGFSQPAGVAVDSSGNIFVSDEGQNSVVEIPAGGGPQITLGTGFSQPENLRVDGAGNVFVADLQNGRIVEIPASGGPEMTLVSNIVDVEDVAVDGSGNLFITDPGSYGILELNRSQAPSFSFTATPVGSTSTDSPMSTQIQNIGNQPLNAVAPGLAIGANFAQVAGSGAVTDCTANFSLAAGQECNLSIAFIPQSVGGVSSTANFTDNALNANPFATQSIPLTGTGTAIAPSITFSVANQTYGAAPFQVSAKSNSNGSFTYMVVSGPATIMGNIVTLTGAGQVTLQASQAASGNYTAGSAPAQFTVAQAAPTITFNVPNQTYGAAPFAVNATSNSSGAFTYSVVSGPATISGNIVTLTGAGPVTLQASQAASGNYAAGSANAMFTVAQAAPTITFNVPNQTYGAAPFAVSATSNSSGAFTYSVVSGPATISGNIVTLTGAGSVTLQASEAASANYTSGSANASFTVAQAAPTITFNVPNQTYGAAPFAVNATSNSSGAFTYSVVSGPATISGNIVTLTGAGSVTLQASEAASGNYAAGSANAMFTVAQAAPTITFNVPNQTYGAAPLAVNATSNSSGAFTYSVVSGPATISGNIVTLTGAGSVKLQASEAAAGNYTSGSANATVTVAQAASTTSLAGSLNPTGGTATLTATVAPATAGSYPAAQTGTVTFYDNGIAIGSPVTLAGGKASITTPTYTGSQSFTAVYNGDTNYLASPASNTVGLSFTVNPTITFTTAATYPYGQSFQLSATSNSSGTFTYTLVSGPATVSSTGLVMVTGEGTVTVQANEAAATGYNAGSKQASFTAVKANSTTTLTATATKSGYGSAATLNVTVAPQYTGVPTGSVTFYDNGTMLATVTLSGGKAAYTTGQLVGAQHSYTATYSGDTNFNTSTSNTATLTIPVTAVSLQFVSTNLVYPLSPIYSVFVTPASGKPAPTGTVAIYDGTTLVTSQPLYAITGGFQLGLVLPPLAAGQHSLTAVYSGDSNYAPGTSVPVIVTVTAGPVKLLLNCNSNSLRTGQTLTCLVNADEGLLPVTGTVTYTVTGWGTGSATLNNAGQATITYPASSKGNFTLTANYAAQGNYQAAQPVTFSYTVN